VLHRVSLCWPHYAMSRRQEIPLPSSALAIGRDFRFALLAGIDFTSNRLRWRRHFGATALWSHIGSVRLSQPQPLLPAVPS
jgi:hypothetical protein